MVLACSTYLQYFGGLCAGYVCIKILSAIAHFANAYIVGSHPDFAKYGKWSVVTGATDGIGLAFAEELAKKGQKIVLISRNPEKLKTTAEKIKKDYNTETKVIAVDFSNNDIYEKIKSELQDLDIGTLVNNVGISYDFPEYFLDIKDRTNFIDKMISLNVTSVAKMTDAVLPGMVLRQRGIILNVSSAAGLHPTPLLTFYSATKKFVEYFSVALDNEYNHKGIIVQCITPFYVTTKLSKIRRPSLLVPTPNAFVRSTIKTIGKTNCTFGYYSHAIQGSLVKLIPESLYISFIANMLKQLRKKALKRHQNKLE